MYFFFRSDLDLEVVVILRGSDQYKFIHVEEYGYVVSYAPRLSSGDHHHLVSFSWRWLRTTLFCILPSWSGMPAI
jgi:hypothetical protein